MTLPNFMVIGAPRCATTSLYHHLKAHPQIYMSPMKEPRFYIYGGDACVPPGVDAITTREAYEALFEAGRDFLYRGEATPTYIGRPGVPQRIREQIPVCKLIVMLRNPVERTLSHYWFRVHQGTEARPFEAVIAAERGLLPVFDAPPGTYALTFSFYHAHLSRFFDYFPRDQLHVELFEDFREAPHGTMARIYAFLGVDGVPTFETLKSHHNQRETGAQRWLNRHPMLKRIYQTMVPSSFQQTIRARLSQASTQPTQPISSDTVAELHEIFAADTLALQHLLDRALSAWLKSDGESAS